MTELKTEWSQYQSKQVAANIVVLLINERSGLCRPIVFVLNQYCSYEVSQYFLFLLGVNTDSVAEPERFFEETQLCLRYGWSLAIWATLQQTLSFIGIDNEQLIRTRFFFFSFFFCYFFSICEFQTFIARSWLRFYFFLVCYIFFTGWNLSDKEQNINSSNPWKSIA